MLAFVRFLAGPAAALLVLAVLGPASALAQGELGGPPPQEGAAPAPDPQVAPDETPPPPPEGYGVQPQPPPPAVPAPLPAGPMAPPADAPGAQDVRLMDANTDRVIMFSTAETHPAGTFFFSDYQLVLLQFGYAITDTAQVALTGVPPLIENQPYFFDLNFKLNVVRSPQFRLAVMGSLNLLVDNDGDGFWGFRPGVVGMLCLSATCQSSVNLNVSSFINDDTSDFLPIITSLGVVGRVSDLFALLLEPFYSFVVGDSIEGIDGFVLNYGVRLSGQNWGVDITLVRPFFPDFENPFILGVPFLSFTYRTDGDRASATTGTSAAQPQGSPSAAATAFGAGPGLRF